MEKSDKTIVHGLEAYDKTSLREVVYFVAIGMMYISL